MIGKIITFFNEVKSELKKTSFPSRRITTQNTIIVIVFSLAIAMFLGGIDMSFAYLLKQYILK